MARRKRTEEVTATTLPVDPSESPATETADAPIPPAASAGSGVSRSMNQDSKTDRLSIPLTADGKINFAQMREGTKKKLLEATAASGVPMAASSEEKPRMVITAQECRGMYGFLGNLEALVAVNFYGVPAEDAERIFTYSDADMDVLTEPTAAVLSKYSTDWMVRYKDEFSLVFALAFVHQKKLRDLQKVRIEMARAEQSETERREHAERMRRQASAVEISPEPESAHG